MNRCEACGACEHEAELGVTTSGRVRCADAHNCTRRTVIAAYDLRDLFGWTDEELSL